jgi:UDP-glucose 4-epimerase
MKFNGKRVAVTGGAGLIGSFLADELVAAGARVAVIDDFSKGRSENLAHLAGSIEIRKGDLEQAAFAAEALGDAEIVFHLASRAFGIAYSEGRHFQILQHNEAITNNLLAALAKRRPAHLLVTSSSCVYPDDGPDTVPELPLFTGEPELANWGYGWAKRLLEQKTLVFARETGVPVSIVRPFNIYGERYAWVGEFSQAIPMLVKKVLDGQNPVQVWGSGRQRRSYVHARDCARMMLAIAGSGHPGPVNIGTEETVSMLDLVGLVCRAAGVRPDIRTDTSKPEGRFVKSADMSLFRSLAPDFRLQVPLEQGIRRMLGWHRAAFGAAVAS